MALPRLLLAWLLVALFFLAWNEAVRRSGVGTRLGASVPEFRPGLKPAALESLLLTLFAALWFASLGSGGWLLLFLLVGLLVEVPLRLRGAMSTGPMWAAVLAGVLRIVGAGGILAWRLG
jgi:hypothetical protein